MDGEWRWRRWELVGIQSDDELILVDAIDLDPDPACVDEALRTIAFVSTRDGMQLGSSDLRHTLSSWVASDEVCDVLQRGDDDDGALLLVQDERLLLFPTRPGGG